MATDICPCGVVDAVNADGLCRVCAAAPHHRECICDECDDYWTASRSRLMEGDFVTRDVGTVIPQDVPADNDFLPVLVERMPEVQKTAREISLPRAAATYIMAKRRRLTGTSERGYTAVLNELTANHPGATLADFEPPNGSILLEDFLTARWGEKAARTYNKSFSILSDFFGWHVDRGTLSRDPMAMLERAKERPVNRVTFTDAQIIQILTTNTQPRDQIALRLLLFFGIRKGALRGIQFENFDQERQRLTVFTKGEKYHTLPIVDETIWELLVQIGEPGHHYLVPKQITRKRIPPRRRELGRLEAALGGARGALEGAIADEACARELGQLLETLDLAKVRLGLAIEAASTQTRYDLTAPIGEHGLHLLWYRWLARAGIVEKGQTSGRRMHSARHTAIQRVLDKTGNLKAAQALAGHATVGTTGDIYTDWSIGQTEQTMRDVLA